MRKVLLATDHAGIAVKKRLMVFFDKKKIPYEDLGPFTLDKTDDYPDFAYTLAKRVAQSKGKERGILICGSGSGMVIAANKIPGIRAAAGYDMYSAKMSRYDNDANILTIRGRNNSFDTITRIVMTWLKTPFSGAVRHKRRIAKIHKLERMKKR